MGIPGFFSFIRKYNNPSDTKNSIIKTKLTTILENEEDNQQQPDEPINTTDIQINNHLFLDFNGAIYTALHKNDVKDIPAFINNVIGYLDILVSINKINTITNKIVKKILIFDTCVIDKKFRGHGLGRVLMQKNNKVIEKHKIPSFLFIISWFF